MPFLLAIDKIRLLQGCTIRRGSRRIRYYTYCYLFTASGAALQHRRPSSPHHLLRRPPTPRPPQLLRDALRRRVPSPTPRPRSTPPARGAQQGLGWTIVGLLLPFVRFLLCQKRTQQVCGARRFLRTHLVAPQSHSSVLVAVKGPSTSYTFRLFSL